MSTRLLLSVIGAVLLAAFIGVAAVLAWPSSDEQAAAEDDGMVTLPAPDGPDAGAIDYAELDARLQAMMDDRATVGMAIGMVEDGKVRFLKGYGERTRGSGEAVDADTRFRWASVSKGVAGTAIAKLATQDRLSLDLPIATYSSTLYLPGGNQESATLRDVVSHRLGLWRNAYDGKLEGGVDPDLIRQNMIFLPQLCPLGQCYSYQNIAFDATSEAVEKVTGEPYGEALRDLFFGPLGMASASVTMDAIQEDENWARPHSRGRSELPMKDAYYRVPAAGGMNSSITDMTIWLQAQMGEFPDVLDDDTLELAHRPLIETRSELRRLREQRERLTDARYAMGWRVYDYAGHRLVGHRGGIDGYRSFILFDPERQAGIVGLWNSGTSQPHGVQFEFFDALYGLEPRDWLELGERPRFGAAQNEGEATSNVMNAL